MQSNNFVEGVSHKIRRQIEELERVAGVETTALTVDGVPVDSYLTRSVFNSIQLLDLLLFCSEIGFFFVWVKFLCFLVDPGLFGMKASTPPCLL